jgi:hypothetical protein
MTRDEFLTAMRGQPKHRLGANSRGKRPDRRPRIRCARNIAHIPAYEDTSMQCTKHHAHEGPHTYDPKHVGRCHAPADGLAAGANYDC